MIRVLLFLALVALLAFGVAWLADRPGEVAITWLGTRIETSLMVMAAAVALIVLAAMLIWALVRTILRSPDLVAMVLSHRRGVRGYLAISRGLISVGAGDGRAAKRFADEAQKIAPGEPLALLLNAQVAQLAGDRASAEASFRAMSERADTKLIGLRGLFVEARRRDDAASARAYAEEAAKAAPALAWAGQAVLDFRCAAGDWNGAQAALDRNSRYGLIDRAQYRRQRAVLLTARALAAEDGDSNRAKSLALDALKLAPSLVPAAALAGRLLGETNEIKKAGRIIERAWQTNPHPDLAETYARLRPGDSARERLNRIEALAARAPRHVESALAVARAAIDAHEFAVARAALQPLLREPTQRVAALMAELEARDSGDEGRAREWMARALNAARDPAWTADGIVSDRWMPVSPASGQLDAFQWKVPLAELSDGRDSDVIEAAEPLPAPLPPEPPPAALAESGAVAERMDDSPSAEARPARRRAALESPRRVDAVIPLAHVPDDPGPEAPHEPDPQPEPPAPRGLRLFK